MDIHDVLQHPLFAAAQQHTGHSHQPKPITWVHVVTEKDPTPWVKKGMLVLSTGQGIATDTNAQGRFVRSLHAAGVAGLVLATPRYFSEIPPACLQAGQELNFPIIELPWEVPFIDVSLALNEIIVNQQHQLIRRINLIHQELTRESLNFSDLQDLADALGRLINRSVLIETVDGMVLAYHKQVDDEDELRSRTVETGRRTNLYAPYLKQIGMYEQAHNTTVPLRIPGSSDGRIKARIWCPIFLVHERVGNVLIIEGEEAFNDVDLGAAELASFIAALFISHQRELDRRDGELGASLLDTLTTEGPLAASTLERARLLGLEKGEWQLLMVVLDMPDALTNQHLRERRRVAANFVDLCKRENVPHLVTTHLNRVLVLAPAGTDFADLANQAGAEGKIFISGVGENLRDVPRLHEQCVTLLNYVQTPGVYTYDNLLIPRALAGDIAAHEAITRRVFTRVAKSRGGDKLVETLEQLARTGFHLANTAEQLGVHITTLRYRIERIEEILEVDLNNPAVRFRVQLALHVRDHSFSVS